jgi:hypothetical protein
MSWRYARVLVGRAPCFINSGLLTVCVRTWSLCTTVLINSYGGLKGCAQDMYTLMSCEVRNLNQMI